MISIMVLGGILTSLAMIMFLHKFDMRKVLYFDKWIDLLLDIVVPVLFVGTLTGMMIAIIAGLLTSVYLHWMKHYRIGYERPRFTWNKWYPAMRWEYVPVR